MRLVIASGKGGTGKTTLATSLAIMAAEEGARVTYVDCDVEEPNGHLLLRPDVLESRAVEVPVPVISDDACTRCGICAASCEFNALASLPTGVTVFPQLCHGCGSCSIVCPADAISEERRRVGTVTSGAVPGLDFLSGTLNVGEASAVPVIRALKERLDGDGLYVIDAPPGTACPAVETMRDADALLLVTEPTPFGLNDLRMAVAAARELGASPEVVINRSGLGDDRVRDYCSSEGLRVAAEIPHSLDVARAYAVGHVPLDADKSFRSAVYELYRQTTAGSRSART
jgi:MinD superfamily P-loop ATPase